MLATSRNGKKTVFLDSVKKTMKKLLLLLRNVAKDKRNVYILRNFAVILIIVDLVSIEFKPKAVSKETFFMQIKCARH